MTNRFKYLFASLIFILPVYSYAGTFVHEGLVNGIYTFASSEGIDKDHFTIKGFTVDKTNNTCPSQDGLVANVFSDDEKADRHYSLVLAAHMAGKPLRVRIRNENKNISGNCYVWLIERID